MTQEIIDIVVKAVFAILGVVLIRYVIPWIKEHLTAEQREALKKLIEDLVKAMEQSPKFAGLLKQGENKKKEVLRILEEKGIEITSEIEALIETAVFEFNKVD